MITDADRARETGDGEEPDLESGPADGRGWGDRIAGAAAQAGDLLRTRVQIFREEAAEKAAHAARGIAGMAIAAGLAIGAVLLFAAFLAAVFAKLLGSVPLGILAAFVLYAGLAALFAWRGSRALGQVKPGEFPVTREELRRDAEALQTALAFGSQEEDQDEDEQRAAEAVRGGEAEVEDLEARFRAGSE
jgi:hypothetical protein